MDNRMDGGNEQFSSQPPSGMPGFQPTQPDRSGTETLRSDLEAAQTSDASLTPHSGGTEFRSGEQQSSGSQWSATQSQYGSRSSNTQSGDSITGTQSRSNWQSDDLQQSDDTSSESAGDTSRWIAMRDRVMETMRRNPVPLALGIAGVAALLMSLRASRTRRF